MPHDRVEKSLIIWAVMIRTSAKSFVDMEKFTAW